MLVSVVAGGSTSEFGDGSDATPRLIGRRRELEVATAHISPPGRPTAVVIEGEPGIGKTALLRRILDDADSTTTTLLCRSAQAETSMSFVALSDILSGIEESDLVALPDVQRQALEAAMLRTAPHGDMPAVRGLAAGLLSLFDSLTTRGPLVIGIDDAQWVDASSESALRFVMRRLGDRPVGLVTTVRSGDAPSSPFGVHDALPDSVTRMVLGPLSLGALHDVVAHHLDVRLARPVLLRVADVSGGNPFYALELVRALVARGSVDDPTALTGLTDRLHRIVDHRILGLTAPARQLVTMAAATPKPTVATLVEAVRSADWTSCGGDDAEDAGLIEVEQGSVRFTHQLLAAAALDNAAPSEVRAAHRRLGEIARDTETRARHLALAATGPDAAVADQLVAAAERAWARGARIAAAELSERAVEMTPAVETFARVERLLRAAAFAVEAGNPSRAKIHLDNVLDGNAEPAQRIAAQIQRGSVRFVVRGFEAKRSSLEEAWRAVAPDDHRTRTKIKIEMVYAGLIGVDRTHLAADTASVLAESELSDDRDLIRAAASVAALAHLMLGDGLDQALLATALAGRDSGEPLTINTRLPVGAILKWTDQLDQARSVLTAELERSSARGDFIEQPILTWLLTDTEILAGNLDQAMRLAEETVDGTRVRAGDLEAALAYSCRAQAHALRGSLSEARHDTDTALTMAGRAGGISLGYTVTTRILIEITAGQYDAVHKVGGPALDAARALGPTDPAFLRWVPDEIEALIGLGKLDDASDALGWYEGLCEATGRLSATGAIRRCRALFEAEAGNDADAVRLAQESVDLTRTAGLPLDHARAMLVMGRIHRRGRRKRLAREWLQRACDQFVAIGAEIWAQHCADEMARSGVRQPAGASSNGFESLTEAEANVAVVVAGGATNKEAAAELFMSAKTIEHHLTRIYAKLAIASRRELPAVLNGHRAGPRPGHLSPDPSAQPEMP